ncbi:MAG TPA: hypothetical protein VKU90_03445 [Caulobacteraceae bacterium]|nr:hypothetical protein [Caulobacteraceae bacterium]
MSIELTGASTPRFGWILSQTFAVIGRRFATIGALTLLLICAPQLAVALLPAEASRNLGIVTSLLGAFYAGSLALIAYHELAGDGPIGGQAAFSAAAGRFGVLFGAGILSGLAVLGGLLLLVLPGLFLMTAWMPLTAVVVVERLGVTASLGRAWRLTEGCRWMLGGLLALYLIGSLLLFSLLALAAGLAAAALAASTGAFIAPLVLGVVISGIVYGVGAVGAAVAYVALRRSKDGIASDVASVFA